MSYATFLIFFFGCVFYFIQKLLLIFILICVYQKLTFNNNAEQQRHLISFDINMHLIDIINEGPSWLRERQA